MCKMMQKYKIKMKWNEDIEKWKTRSWKIKLKRWKEMETYKNNWEKETAKSYESMKVRKIKKFFFQRKTKNLEHSSFHF